MPFNTITYGQFSFGYKKMTVTHTPRYGDNGIDQTGIKYEFRVRGWLTAPDGATFAQLICQTKSLLAKPRQNFRVQWSDDGTNYNTLYDFEVGADGAGDDVAWGPLPGPLSITEFAGGRAALFEWSLSVESKRCFGDCTGTAADPPTDILTWSVAYDHQIGPDGLTTRTVSGRLEVTSESVVNKQNADFFRYLVTPDVPTNFKRDSQSFKCSSDGRYLDYSITDKEAVWTLPKPITTGRATWSVNIPSVYSLMADYRLSGTFTGTATTPKSAIIQQILQLASNRFASASAGAGANGLIQGSKNLEEDVYGNSVTFSFTAQGPVGGTGSPFDPNTGYASFGQQPPGADGHPQMIGFYGGDGTDNSGVMATSPVPYDACSPKFPSGGDGSSGSLNTTNPGGDPTSTIPGYQQPPTQGVQEFGVLNVSNDHLQSPWFLYKETISWEVDNGKKLFYPKVSGLAPLVQQTRNPKLTIIQAGHAERWATDVNNGPPFPAPVYDENSVAWLNMSQTTHDPIPVGSSTWNLYAISWAYVMEWTTNFGSSPSPLGLKYSQDPRRPGATAAVNNPPNIVSPPSQD